MRNADGVGPRSLGMGHLWGPGRRELSSSAELSAMCKRKCGLKEGLSNIQSCPGMEWATLRGSELPVLGDVQSEDGGRYNSEALRLWHQTDLDLNCNLGALGQRTSPLRASVS